MEEARNTQTEKENAEITTLDKVLPPERCSVVSVSATGSFRRRLLALGFIPGTPIEAVRVAPLGDPVEYRIKGYYISLRKEDARSVSVVLEESTS